MEEPYWETDNVTNGCHCGLVHAIVFQSESFVKFWPKHNCGTISPILTIPLYADVETVKADILAEVPR